jgi:hypothetical protein
MKTFEAISNATVVICTSPFEFNRERKKTLIVLAERICGALLGVSKVFGARELAANSRPAGWT